ncbi:Outer membrane receptor proteins, mostly Fe transport [Methylobacillus rhizosphaerae]|uniref:Outer membrane receptor proteins, mostly Fe transport n=1 Tax=Methylobacillus rhizosphaerae TaxID=551994 RepID=A0A238YVK5_9PROT|nr:TonB-dependent receptor [Methylobacillus rhizosphaerae]SNR74838.1 Outer membrane receptor proteins, mostly Fe transport [Methylobacillus rhizosphaerae]
MAGNVASICKNTGERHSRKPISALLMLLFSTATLPLAAEPLNTSIPTQTYNIPPGDLDQALTLYAGNAGVLLSFDSGLTLQKKTTGLKGNYGVMQGFSELLKGTGLEIVQGEGGRYQLQRATVQEHDKLPGEQSNLKFKVDSVEVRAKRFYEVGPLPGLGLTKEEIPGNVQSLTAKEIKEAQSLSLTDLLNSKFQSVTVNDYQSNPFQMDLQYRGFAASPQLGTAQGISVFLDGIRVNEPFGDVVNWDMLPMNALSSLDLVPGSNPIYGLGTLGGALTMKTKSGFDNPGVDAQVLTGSFGRKQLQASAGWNNGVVAGFLAGNFFLEDGWRDDSPSRVNQVFGKAEWQSERARLGLSVLYAGNKLTGNGLLPQQMVDQNPKQVYTSPDESRNNLLQFQLSGIWDVTDTFNITGQIYNRKSKRKSSTSDINENFGGTDGRPNRATTKDPNQQLLYGYPDINRDGRPDYNDYAYNVAADASGRALDVNGIAYGEPGFDINNLAYGTNFTTQAIAQQAQVTAADGSSTQVWNWTYDPRKDFDDFTQPSTIAGVFNAPTTVEFENIVKYAIANYGTLVSEADPTRLSSNTTHPGSGQTSYIYDVTGSQGQSGVIATYTDDAGFFHDYWELLLPINYGNVANAVGAVGGLSYIPTIGPLVLDENGNYNGIFRDGKYGGGAGLLDTGYIEGTPTAIFNDTQIDQLGKGASLQLNWNLDEHKFMVGASIDKADATYVSKQYLGLLDANRHGYVAPDLLGWEYYANAPERAQGLNDFKGDGLTKSVYLSETWTPTKTLSITASARYNRTYVNNQLAVSKLSSFTDVNTILNYLQLAQLCTDNNSDGTIDPNTECPHGLDHAILPFDPSTFPTDPFGNNIANLLAPETERFKYRSFNPSIGFTWQAQEDLNVYASVGRGARTPSVIELGCAYDPTPMSDGRPRSIVEQRVCNLPGGMSGDPYLKQVRSTTFEMGARGRLSENIEWNATAYRTDLTDDIYFVSINAFSSYFQNIGDTRRQGLELGLKGKWGKASWGVNYALTDATFQSVMRMASPHNSTAGNVYDINSFTQQGTYQQITVHPGDRMPGVPLHNLNFNFGYDITDKWRIGLTAIMHSEAFVRGNENNKHRAGAARPIEGPFCTDPVSGVTGQWCSVERADFGSGKTAGYAVFNLRTTYKLAPEWTLGLQINNLFDKEYASAGRLGLNAFSPSIRGAIGASGFNYNSADWQGSSFLGIGAPRAAWVTLNYEFDPKR